MASEPTVELPRPDLSAAKRAFIEARLRGQVRASGIVPRADRDSAPLSFAQERLWFMDRLEPGSAAYNVSLARRLGGALDEAALERALGEITRRHEALRTVFREVDGSPVQVIAPPGDFTLQIDDLSGLADGDREAVVRRRATGEAELPFDLTAGPLFRARVLRLDGESHVLLLSMHHIVSDGWSMGVFFRELSVLYEAYRAGRESPLPELPVQYADYAVWQREHLRGEVLERHLSYWRKQLADAPALLELPTDHPRPAVQTFRGAHEQIELPGELLERLRALGRSEGATLYMVVLSAFQVLLSKYSGTEDIVVGSPIAGRTKKEVTGLIGFFANMLALRTDLSGDPGFREVLHRVREVTLGAYEHQALPFEKLVAELRPERSLSHSPLFQVSFALEDVEESENGVAERSNEGVDADFSFAKFDLTLAFAARGQDLRGALSYSTDLFERGTIVRMLGHLARVLEQVAADADVRLSRLELLGEAERALVIDAWNRTESAYPADRCIHELFEAQAARTPGAIAATGGTVALTYAELNTRANRLARHLVRLGVGPETRVGVCLERGPELMVCTLAVLKAGGAYVAMDPAYPPARLELMLRDSGAAVLLTDGRGTVSAEQDGVHVVRMDRGAHPFAAESAADLPNPVSPRNVAYVVYTSGSTGAPKGVAVDHASLGALCAWHVRAFGVTAADRGTQVANPGFDAAVWEAWPYLTRGASVHGVPEEVRADPPALRDWLVEHAVTVSFIPTPVAEPMLALEWPADAPLRWLLTGGDRLRARPRAEMPFALANNYGPTECTVVATSGVVTAGGARTPSIGRPIENTRVYVLDAGLRPLPVGVPGELCIGGAQVTRGYLNRPALTAERFVPDPFSVEGGARLYRSGDRVRWLPDGTVEYLGRLDEQVKVRGFRIELGEIEAALRRSEGVADCVVVAREDVPGEKRLVAYVVGDVDARVLREHLRRELPEYMVPAAFVPLERLPLTPRGKLDRKALPAPEHGTAEEKYVAPRTEVEEVVAGIWAEVLGIERVGIRDNFFALGGHSLLATQVTARVAALLGVEIPLRALFEAPTVAALAAQIELERRAGEGAALPPLAPVAREAPPPLSFAQERLWFLHQMEPEGSRYNMFWPRRLRGCLDAAALERALGELVRRHEALRTTFRPVEQGAVQVVHPPAPAHVPVLDLTGLAPQDREHEARRLVREGAERPFDLERGPLLRAMLMRLADEEHVLLLTMHHIVSDGWSMGVLLRELFTLYESLSQPSDAAPSASPLPPLTVQYADFAVWQRGWLRGEVLRRQLDWWRERLGGAPPALELPTDRPRPAVASSRGASHVFRLPADVTRGLRALARREGATLYMVTHAALDLLLSRWSGQEDLVVGSPIAGRTQVGTEGLIGFFVNTLALRIDLAGDPSFRELVHRVRETALGAYAHQDLPFERLVEEVAPERGLSHTPLFQVMFALQNADSGEETAVAGLQSEPFGGEIRTVRFDLELDLTEVGEELAGSLRFRTDLFDAATIERFAAQYQTLLGAVCAAPEERLSRLSLLPDEEVRRILAFGAGPARDGGGDAPAHLLFAAQAARTPGATAVLFEGESLTYAELNACADRLALELRSRGVRAGTTVAVCLARGTGSVVAPLAVWKTGGVYLPLDPGYPAERLSFLLRDSGASHVLTESGVADVLPEYEAEVVLMDGPPLPPASFPPAGKEEHDLASEPGGDDLAYLLYSSEATDTPRAVMVEHGQLAHTLSGARETFGFRADDVVPALASVAFDISLLELIAPLLAGAAIRVVPPALVRDAEALVDAVADVTVLHAVPALMRQVVEAARGGRTLPGIRLLLVGGDTVPPDLLEDMRALFPAAETRVLYGPTEGTIICATYAVPMEGAIVGHPLGRPLPGVRLAVRSPRGEMAPLGVPGEVWISGGGVARGYLGRPEPSAEKFVGAGVERAYRTGDRARWRADGVLEFLGRTDEQVKVRGFRIESGEVEDVLRGHPGVREAVVLAREDALGGRQLVAYVVPGPDDAGTVGDTAQVSEWETLFDDTYAQDEDEEDPTLRLKGWDSSYTGEPIPREEMRAWVEHTVARILALRPERVLEIGCGTGLLLFRVAPHTRAYHGTDFSGVVLEHVGRHLAELPQVSLSEGEADRLDDYAGAEFDLVVVNSVAQYFPDVDYLLRVLEGAAAALRPGGRIFMGDIRSLPLAGAFHASVELARVPEGLPAEQLRARVRQGMAEEQELLLDPALFEALRARMPRLGRVEVQAKRGDADNEVTRFRYDVVLHLDADIADAADPVARAWDGEDADGLRALAEGSASALLVRGVPDARVREHVRAYELVLAGQATDAAAVRARAAEDAGGIAPEALFALGDELARGIEVRPGAPGTLDVLFHPAAGVTHFPAAVDAERPWESYANDPQWGRRVGALVPALREAARARLPEYMVPSAFVVLEAFPVTADGRVDREALPAPDTPGSRGGTYVAPRTPAEERMAGIWAEVLGVERVGAEDHFFDLGGHSLLATRLVSRVREVFRTELPLRAVFEAPTLAELTGRVEAFREETVADAGAPPLVPVPRDGSPLPLSFAQQRLWFIDQLESRSTAYHMPSALRLRGPLDPRVLERALGEVVRRHEALRTTFGETEGVPFQVVHPAGVARLELTDLSRLAPAERPAEARQRVREEARRPFDLRRGPLLRTHLVRLGEEEHVLVLAMHHVVSDGWSMEVLFGEVATLYEAFARGQASPLPELPVQYADYAVWQRAWLAGEAMERQIAWWHERLEGAPPVLELPTDRRRQATPDTRGGRVFRVLPSQTAEGMRALARREGATLYMVLLAVLDLLLARWSGQEDVVVGTPIANRTRRETEGLIGFFVNTLALRADVSGNPRVSELLERVRETTLGAYQHQDVPFERLVEALQVERSLSHTPLFQVMFSLIDGTGGPRPFGGLAVEPYPTGAGAAKFDLDVMVVERQEGLEVGFTYREELWDASTLERVAGAYALLLEAVAVEPGRRVLEIPLMTDAERERVLRDCRATVTGIPRQACIHERFQARALERPHAPALTFEATTLTYRELNEHANRLAHRLRALGVTPGTRVGIALERSAELVAAILAVLKAGGAYVPLDPSYPAERIAFVLEDAGVPVLVTASHLVPQLPAFAGAVLCVDAEAEAIAAESGENPGVEAKPDSLAYVIYTSGSTGKPKGVQVTHANVVRLFDATESWFGFAADDVWTLFHSCAFDFSVWEIWGALLHGGRLVVVPFLTTRSPEDFHRLLVDEGVTMLSQTPSAFKQLVQADLASGVDPSALRLRSVVFGGEALDPQALRPWMERHGDERPRLVNMYGITETTVHVTYRVITRADLDRAGSPIGVPIPDLSLYVLDSRLEPVPPGIPGELFVGGAGVARGYLNRPQLTAERFLRDPFSADPAARLYRSGDRVRRREDSELEYLGRADQQVKIRGFRIEPGEIEAALLELPGIHDAAVLVRDEARGEKQLVAYVVLHPGEAEDPTAMRDALSGWLPDYMVPAVFVVLPEMPLTANGKLDRRALPAPEAGRTLRPAYASPASAAERLLQEVWQEVLGVERVGVLENFFAAGGDSMRAVQLVAVLRKRGMALTVRDLFKEPTIRGLAERTDAAARAGGAPDGSVPHHLADLPAEAWSHVRARFPEPVQDVYPATRMQAVMLSEYAKDTARAGIYHPQQCHRLTDASLSTDALRHAIEQVVRRHAILRTVFAMGSDGTLLQVVRERPCVPIGYQDLRGLSPDEQERAVQARVAEDLDTPFDPFDPTGSLMRFVIFHREDHVADLLISAHHAIEDGWGNVHFIDTLFEAYADVRDGRPVSAAPVPNTYREFVALEAEILASDEARTFWRDRMRNVSSPWPTPHGGPGESARECRVVRAVAPELTAALREAASREGVALKALYLSSFLDVLATLSGGEGACVGVVWNGRSERLSDPLTALGLFWNLLPVARPATASGGAAGRALAVHQDLLHADLFGRYPLAEIMADRGGREPFFSTFNFLHFRNGSDRGAVRSGRVEPVYALDRLHLPFNLAVSLAPHGEGAGVRVEYDDRFFSRDDVTAVLESYLRRLEELTSTTAGSQPRRS